MTYGSPRYWHELRDRQTKRWFETWMPSLASSLSIRAAVKSKGSFALLTTAMGTGRRHKLADCIGSQKNVLVLCAPMMRPSWESLFNLERVVTESFWKACRWSEGERLRMLEGVDVLIIEAPVSRDTKAFIGLRRVVEAFEGQVITTAFWVIDKDRPPPHVWTALRLLGNPPAMVAWEPPKSADDVEKLVKLGGR